QSKAFVHIAKQVLPSVVTITSERTVQVTGMPGPGGGFRFFGDDFFRFFNTPERVPQTGSGSGVIISPDGYVLTNNHVVREADQIRVTLEDGRTFDAEMVGTDPKSDVAVIRIKADDLVPARLGNSDELEVGEWVLAVGNPFQLSSTVTAGIVSAVGRSNIGLADYEDFIQTDAAINPGNSGGALVNLDGEVVGINTAIATRSGANEGVGFAIPINMASRIKDSLIHEGKVVRGWLGVNIQNLNESTAEIFGLDRPQGALVSQVVPGSPAADAGLRVRDVITEIDGRPVKDVEDLQLQVVDRAPGTRVKLTVQREGRDRTVEVKLGELEAESVPDSRGGERPDRWSS
ncbi:MAG: Do family serine endopeptidase, partial [Candidatus Eisenbacteria bacterium]|nr:Do family serine endopeptidase [Candidatus Eisenbacteria bacterium]